MSTDGGLVASGLDLLRAVPRRLPVGPLALSDTASGPCLWGPSLDLRGAAVLLGAPGPGAVAFLFPVGSLVSSPTGPLVPVAGLGLFVLVVALVLGSVLMLGI